MVRGIKAVTSEWRLMCASHNMLKLWRSGAQKIFENRQTASAMAIDVPMGKIAFAKSPETFEVLGLGSCIVVTLYDPRLKTGALSHAAFCLAKGDAPLYKDAAYIEIAIGEMIGKLSAGGSKRNDLEAKLIGAANMFSGTSSNFSENNIMAAREKLASEGIKIVGESVGGNMGRSVEFALDTGIVTVRMKF